MNKNEWSPIIQLNKKPAIIIYIIAITLTHISAGNKCHLTAYDIKQYRPKQQW